MKLSELSLQIAGKTAYLEFLCDFHADSLMKNWGSDPKVFESLSSQHVDTLDKVHRVIVNSTASYNSGKLMRFAIKTLDHDAIGILTLTNHGNNLFELGYSIGSKHWGKGVVTEVVGSLLSELKSYNEDFNIMATVLSENPGSEKVLNKNGFIDKGSFLRSRIYGEDCKNPSGFTRLFTQNVLSLEKKLETSFDN